MARAVDADVMLAELKPIDYEAEHSAVLISDVAKIMREWVERQPTLTPPNEALICDGCLWAEMGALEKCSSCMRDKKDHYYRRPPEGEEDT